MIEEVVKKLIEDLNVGGRDLLRVWKYKAEFCKDFGGVLVHHTHPVHLAGRLECYKEFIGFLKRMGFRVIRLRDLYRECVLNSIKSGGAGQSEAGTSDDV